MDPIPIAVSAPFGRMGGEILRLAVTDPAFRVCGVLVREEKAAAGRDLAVPVGVGLPEGARVLIEFTPPSATLEHLRACCERRVAIVIGTTGMDAAGETAIREAARDIPVVWAPNTSIGIVLLEQLVEEAARRLGPDWDIEIVEAHHRMKQDAPSGTALLLGRAAARGRGLDLESAAAHGRRGRDPRSVGQIGFHAVRGGGIVGDHTVLLAGPFERIELIHRVESRRSFAQGALLAARFLHGRAPGLYRMEDVLRPTGVESDSRTADLP